MLEIPERRTERRNGESVKIMHWRRGQSLLSLIFPVEFVGLDMWRPEVGVGSCSYPAWSGRCRVHHWSEFVTVGISVKPMKSSSSHMRTSRCQMIYCRGGARFCQWGPEIGRELEICTAVGEDKYRRIQFRKLVRQTESVEPVVGRKLKGFLPFVTRGSFVT